MNNKICECVESNEVLEGIYYVCSKCGVITDDLIFENNIYMNEGFRNRTRYNKFTKYLFSTTDLPWYVRETFIDIFNNIENHFFISERINFINMGQLCIELCKYTGYSKYSNLFTPLKTKARVRQVQEFVRSALNINRTGRVVNLSKMSDIDLISKVIESYEEPKNKGMDHIFSDRKCFASVLSVAEFGVGNDVGKIPA